MFRGLLPVPVPIQISDLEKLCFTQREGPTQLMLQPKSRMPLARLVYFLVKKFPRKLHVYNIHHDEVKVSLKLACITVIEKFLKVGKSLTNP